MYFYRGFFLFNIKANGGGDNPPAPTPPLLGYAPGWVTHLRMLLLYDDNKMKMASSQIVTIWQVLQSMLSQPASGLTQHPHNSVWCRINRKTVMTIQIWFHLARFRKKFPCL